MCARVLTALLSATLVGCLTNVAQRSQRVAVVTEPSDANVWVMDSQGHRAMGRSPTTVMTSYEVEETEFFDACWTAPAVFGLGTVGGVIAGFASDDDAIGLIIGMTYGLMTLASLGACLAGKELEGDEPLHQTVTIGASLPGRADTNVLVQVPGGDDLEVRLYLPPAR